MCVVTSPLVKPNIPTRSRSRSLILPVLQEIAMDFLGRRIAKNFDGGIFFGTVSGRVRGLVVVVEPGNETRLLQAVWKVAYDDGDSEQLSSVELLVELLVELHRLHAQEDPRKSRSLELDFETYIQEGDAEAPVMDTENSEEPMWGTGTDCLDPKYNLLDQLTPTATQNRLSYLVELVIDQAAKRISNEAVKLRLQKNAGAFGAKEMSTDVRSISRYLGARTLSEVTRHRCGTDACSYAWIGVVSPTNYNAEDICPKCATPRYKTVGEGILIPPTIILLFWCSKRCGGFAPASYISRKSEKGCGHYYKYLSE
jgi:hypothetical protein